MTEIICAIVLVGIGAALAAVDSARRNDGREAVKLAAFVGLGALVAFASWLAFA